MEIAVFPPLVAAATIMAVIVSLENSSGMAKSASSCVSVMESLEMSVAHHHLAVTKKSAVWWRGGMAVILVHMVAVMLLEIPIMSPLIEPTLTFKAHADMCWPQCVMILVDYHTFKLMQEMQHGMDGLCQ
ncbi:hypothetical protein R3I94_019394 [Phoxinus phoxinus]